MTEGGPVMAVNEEALRAALDEAFAAFTAATTVEDLRVAALGIVSEFQVVVDALWPE